MTEPVSQPSYDDIPYPDISQPYTHPGRLAAIARLLNMRPVPVERCRVLELGCAGGGNLVPMAYGLPESTFVGVDNALRQIEAAQHFARALGLKNIRFQHMDVLDISPEFGQFDYIIAHGLYAWVPPHVQDKIMSICKHNLSPQGVAYISYNTFPGWHMILTVRDLMRYRTRRITDPRERAQTARAFVADFVNIIPNTTNSAYSAFLKQYMGIRFNRFASYPPWEDSTLLHDELGAINQPIYFYQFAAHAARHGLQFLAEADFSQVMLHDLDDETKQQVRQLSGSLIDVQQYLDFVRFQTFRSTLLCHAGVPLDRRLSGERIHDLYIASRAELVQTEDNRVFFQTYDGSTFPAEQPVTTAALYYLSAISPRAVPFEALLQTACAQLGLDPAGEDHRETLASDLLEAYTYSTQLAELLACDPALTVTISDHPKTSAVARFQADITPIVSNLRHEQVELDNLTRLLMPSLDGQHDHAALLDVLVNLVETGRFTPSRQPTNPQQRRQLMARYLDHILRWLAQAGMLES